MTNASTQTSNQTKYWALTDDIWVEVNSKGFIQTLNPAGVAVFDVKEKAIQPLSIFDQIHSEELEAFKSKFDQVVQTNVSTQLSARTKVKQRWYNWNIEKVESNHVIIVGRDNHELQQSLLKLKKSSVQTFKSLKARNKELEQFVYVASHDLQEPLRTISGFIDILDKRFGAQLTNEAGLYFNYISESAERMRQLIAALLDYSHLSSVKKIESVDLKHVFKSITSDLHAQILNSTAFLEIDSLPTVEGDPLQLKQLFQNLLGNAIKFSDPDRQPKIKITSKSFLNHYEITITDNGIGIEPQHLERIFVIFQRLHDRSDYQGTGIGLAYCKKIAEAHGGDIRVKSTFGEGSAFTVSIRKELDKNL